MRSSPSRTLPPLGALVQIFGERFDQGMHRPHGIFRREKPDVFQDCRCIAQQTAAPCRATMGALHNLRLESRSFVRLPLHRLNGANGMNTPCWEAGGWTALVGGNPTERIGRSRVSDIEGKVTRVGASERGQRTSFNRGKGFPR